MSDLMEVLRKISEADEVDAIALGGSRATKKNDEKSDYDIYLYINREFPIEKRREILEKECSHLELGNHYWELEDNGMLHDGTNFDFVYRNPAVFDRQLEEVVFRCKPQNSYTTCFWYNLLTCQILYEKDGLLTKMKGKYDVPYPQELKRAIVINNLNLLHGVLPSFDKQIEKAVLRRDFVSVNHRVAEFLAAYFDLIFAINELPHCGEKGLVQICKTQCKILPHHFEKNFIRLFRSMFTAEILVVVDKMVNEINRTCKEQGLIE